MIEIPKIDEWVTDKEIARRWRLSEKTARAALRGLERDPAFPRRDPLFGGRRYWPAVVAFVRRRAGVTVDAPPLNGDAGIVENFDESTETRKD